MIVMLISLGELLNTKYPYETVLLQPTGKAYSLLTDRLITG